MCIQNSNKFNHMQTYQITLYTGALSGTYDGSAGCAYVNRSLPNQSWSGLTSRMLGTPVPWYQRHKIKETWVAD
jgi:hypothetical protein